jgi:hypothetical protein
MFYLNLREYEIVAVVARIEFSPGKKKKKLLLKVHTCQCSDQSFPENPG